MKPRFLLPAFPLLAPATFTLFAAGVIDADAQVKLPPIQFEESNRQGYFIRIGPRIQYNVEASVGHTLSTSQQTGYYDDGFVLADSGGSASGLTWNWGYENASQLAGDFINYNRYSNLPVSGNFSGGSDDQSLGAELLAGVEIGRFAIGTREFAWGVELGYGYNPFKLAHQATATGTVNYVAASHSLGGIVPPVAPYSGTATGPGPLLNLTPSTYTEITSAATSTFNGTLTSDLHNFKFGGWLETELTDNFSLNFSAGYASIYADTQLKFRETVTIANPGIPALAATDTTAGGRNWQSGFYAQLRGTWQFSPNVGVYVAGDFQSNENFEFSEAGQDIKLDFKTTYGVGLGLIFSW